MPISYEPLAFTNYTSDITHMSRPNLKAVVDAGILPRTKPLPVDLVLLAYQRALRQLVVLSIPLPKWHLCRWIDLIK